MLSMVQFMATTGTVDWGVQIRALMVEDAVPVSDPRMCVYIRGYWIVQ